MAEPSFPPRSAENPERITGWKLSRVHSDAETEDWVLVLSNGEHFMLQKYRNVAIADQVLGDTHG